MKFHQQSLDTQQSTCQRMSQRQVTKTFLKDKMQVRFCIKITAET